MDLTVLIKMASKMASNEQTSPFLNLVRLLEFCKQDKRTKKGKYLRDLEKLVLLAMSRSSFPDYGATSQDPDVSFSGESRELKILCDSISTNIHTINSFTGNLQGVLPVLGTSRERQGLRDDISVWQLSANEMVKATTADITRLTVLARRANKLQKLQAEKITNHFKEAVESYGKVQVAVVQKARTTLPKQTLTADNDQSPLLEDEERQQLQVQLQLEFDNDLLAEREQRVQEIESNILDVNQLMRELGALVNEQSAQVDTIESNIEAGVNNVAEGANELRSAANYQNKARRRNLILFAVLAIVLAVLIGIIIYSSR